MSEALARLEEALRRESPWPGFHPGEWPVLLLTPDGAFCCGHPDPGPGESCGPSTVRLAEAPPSGRDSFRGVPTAWVEEGPDLAGRLWEAAFRLHLRHRLGQQPPSGMPDPDPSPVAAAMAELEELVRGEALVAAAERLPRALRTLCLVRRERRGPLPDGETAWEDAAEVWEGLPAYVAGTPRNGRRARAGAGAAQLLDRLMPGWQAAWEAGVDDLTGLLERHVRFDGGEGDEALLLGAQGRHGYPRLLAEARTRIAAARTARDALVREILRGEGTLLVVDTSALGEGFVEAAEAGQRVNAGMSVYAGEVAFRFRGAEVFFHEVPVVHDRRAGLLQARIRGHVRMSGDGEPLAAEAEFMEGLDMDLAGIRLRARSGSVRPMDAGLYVKLEPEAGGGS